MACGTTRPRARLVPQLHATLTLRITLKRVLVSSPLCD